MDGNAEKTMDRNGRKIKKSLMLQLRMKGADVAHFSGLIGDYVELYKLKTRLLEDIRERGVTYQEISSSGNLITKNNPSNKEVQGVLREMRGILKDLGLTTEDAAENADAEL
jgi:phage terminase small subunit